MKIIEMMRDIPRNVRMLLSQEAGIFPQDASRGGRAQSA